MVEGVRAYKRILDDQKLQLSDFLNKATNGLTYPPKVPATSKSLQQLQIRPLWKDKIKVLQTCSSTTVAQLQSTTLMPSRLPHLASNNQ